MAKNKIKKESGFTLIEVIVSLILVGFLAAIGGRLIVWGVKGYTRTKDYTEMAQKPQPAMTRLNREIIEMTDLTADATSSSFSVQNINGDRTIRLVDGKIKIDDGTNDYILIDDVYDFTLTYYDSDDDDFTEWPVTKDIKTLSAIDISLKLNRSDGGYVEFATSVTLRNNKRDIF